MTLSPNRPWGFNKEASRKRVTVVAFKIVPSYDKGGSTGIKRYPCTAPFEGYPKPVHPAQLLVVHPFLVPETAGSFKNPVRIPFSTIENVPLFPDLDNNIFMFSSTIAWQARRHPVGSSNFFSDGVGEERASAPDITRIRQEPHSPGTSAPDSNRDDQAVEDGITGFPLPGEARFSLQV